MARNLDLTMKIKANAAEAQQEIDKVANDLKALAPALDAQGIMKKYKDIVSGNDSLQAKLKGTKKLLAELNINNLGNTSIYTEMSKYAGELSDAISDASASVSRFASDTMKLDSAIQAFQGITAVGTLATSAMNLFGIENENVAQAILKVQSALAVLNSLQTISNILNKDSALMLSLKSTWHGIVTAAKVKDTIATIANTTAETANIKTGKLAIKMMTAWNVVTAIGLALKKNWIALTAAAAAAFGVYKMCTMQSSAALEDNTQDIIDNNSARNQQIETINSFASKFGQAAGEAVLKFKSLRDEWKKLQSEAEKRQFIKDYANEMQSLGLSINNINDAENVFSKNTSKVVAALIARAKAAAAQQILLDKYQKYYQHKYEVENNPTHENGGLPAKQWQAGVEYSASEMSEIMQAYASFMGKTVNEIKHEFYNRATGQIKTTITERQAELANEGSRLRSYHAKNDPYSDMIQTEGWVEKIIAEAKAEMAAAGLTDNHNNNNNNNDTNTEEPAPEGSLNALEKQLQEAQRELRNLGKDAAEETVAEMRKNIDKLTNDIQQRKIELGMELAPTVFETLNRQLSDIERQIDDAITNKASDDTIKELIEKRVDIERQINEAEIRAGRREPEPEPEPEPLYKSKTDTDEFTRSDASRKMNALQTAQSDVDVYSDLFKNGIISATEFEEKISEINEALNELGLKKIDLIPKETSDGIRDVTTETERAAEARAKMAESINAVGGAFNQLGNSLASVMEDEAGKKAMLIAAAIGQLAMSFATAMQSASSNWITWLAFGVSGAATLATLVSQIQGYATGGIIGGNDYNDGIVARLSSGEMVLNKKQQSSLFQMINAGANNNAQTQPGKVEFVLTGKKLHGVLRNYDNVTNKIR